jgi:uncharacterized membrane protein (UPF0127 family)
MHIVHLQNTTHPLPTPIKAKYCNSFWSRFRGLMLEPAIGENEGLILVEDNDTRIDSAIHMLFMNFDITAVWLNKKNMVVDVKLAKRWALAYIPQSPASFVLETHAAQFNNFNVGDTINLDHV